MEELLPLTSAREASSVEAYDPVPFAVGRLDATVQRHRPVPKPVGDLEARASEGSAGGRRGHPSARPRSARLGSAQRGPAGTAIEVRRRRLEYRLYFPSRTGGRVRDIGSQEVLAQHTATDVIAALRAHRVPESGWGRRADGDLTASVLAARSAYSQRSRSPGSQGPDAAHGTRQRQPLPREARAGRTSSGVHHR